LHDDDVDVALRGDPIQRAEKLRGDPLAGALLEYCQIADVDLATIFLELVHLIGCAAADDLALHNPKSLAEDWWSRAESNR
jgi:hypothetical protein